MLARLNAHGRVAGRAPRARNCDLRAAGQQVTHDQRPAYSSMRLECAESLAAEFNCRRCIIGSHFERGDLLDDQAASVWTFGGSS